MINIVKRKLMILFVFVGFSFFLTTNAVASLADTIERIKPSIVGIGTLLETRRPPAKLMGTGFFVANGRYVITNSHVVPESLDEEHREKLIVFIGQGNDVIRRFATIISRDRTHDLALLKVSDFKMPSMKLGNIENVREGDLFAFTGFPIGAVLGLYPVTHRGIVSAISPVAIPVTSSRSLTIAMIKRLRNPYNVLQLDATAYPGNSGSPLYDAETGVVVGVINKVFIKETKESVLEKPSGITYAIPVNFVKDLLKDAGLAF